MKITRDRLQVFLLLYTTRFRQIIVILLTLISPAVYAQNITIKIQNQQLVQIAGASIRANKTLVGSTDSQGEFHVDKKLIENKSLLISAIGYQQLTVRK